MIGEHIILLFEDFKTIRYQVQEMLRIEKITKKEDVEDELGAYTPLIPDGNNLKATMLIMYPNVSQRKKMLTKLNGIENEVWICADNLKRVFAIADEDLERSNERKTSAVHFLRFQFDEEYIKSIKNAKNISIGTNHSDYEFSTELSDNIAESLLDDLD
tara:strand:- start:846 stop:1322 length:477 start_codon:yes stop_codon:yes gene_type:complete